MTNSRVDTVLSRLRRAQARLPVYARALAMRASGPRDHRPAWRALLQSRTGSRLRNGGLILGGTAAVVALVCGALYWRLASGPLAVDMVTPWLTAALEERFGGQHRIEVGGTQLERDEDGRTALRLRDIVVRDIHGSVVASAPKADIGIAGASLFTGHVRPQRLSLIGAEMAVRIERDGQFVLFAGADRGTFTTAGAGTVAPERAGSETRTATAVPGALAEAPAPSGPGLLAALASWLQNLDAVGLDGKDLIEIGLKSGSIAVDDRRSNKLLTFANIDLSLTRPKEGGAALAVSSMGTDGPWSVNATITPRGDGRRAVEAVVRDVSPKDILLALRLGGGLQTDVPLSGVVRAELGEQGALQSLEGRIIAGAGYIGGSEDRASGILIDEAHAELRWDAAKRHLLIPIDIQSGASRVMLMARLGAPAAAGGPWSIAVGQGKIVLASLDRARDPPLLLDRVTLRASMDPAQRRFTLEQADVRGASGGLAFSGGLDYSGAEPRLMLGVAGTRMSMPAFKRLWPTFIAPAVRAWVDERILSGVVERVEIAMNAPASVLTSVAGSIPDDGLSIDIVARGTTVLPIDSLPPLRDADLTARITGRTATVSFGRSTAELPSGRKLTISNGVFEVPDFGPRNAPTRTRFRIEGGVDAAAELLAMERLRDAAALPFDAATARGTLAAQVSLGLPLSNAILASSLQYTIEADLTGFSAERFIRSQKAEAGTLRVSATQQGVQVKGDLKIAGNPAVIEFRKARGEADAEIRIQTTLDDAARARMGFDFGPGLTGPVPVKLNGRVKMAERESRIAVEADLTQAKVTEMLPGWIKPAGRAGRSSFVMLEKGATTRLEDFVLEGGGTSVKGTVEIDANGEVLNANFPSFALSDGDKASLKAERAADGTLKVALRGDVFDGRVFVKTAVAGSKPEQRPQRPPSDLDLDIKLGAVPGHHGEALRSLELRLSRRGGEIRSFTLSGRLGADGQIAGDLRARGGARPVLYLEANDAGALFRFTDTYPRIVGGAMSVAMDPPRSDASPQEGLLNIRDFAVRGEPALERVASSGPPSTDGRSATAAQGSGVGFSRMRVEFTRSPGRFAIRDGVVWGPSIGATVDGYLDYAQDEVRLRGTFVPAYALNNMFGRLPIVGLFLGGGSNEGLLGITYQVVGSPHAPVLQVNPMSAVAPGFLRKLFEFRGGNDTVARPPESVR